MKPPCRHCGKRKGVCARVLCNPCYYTPGVREQYPKKVNNDTENMTDEQLDALIATQMATLPMWWNREHKRERDGDPAGVLELKPIKIFTSRRPMPRPF